MLSKIENGTISPSLATLDALAKALNVSISQLVRRNRRAARLLVRQGRHRACASSGAAPRPATSTICSGHSLAGEIGVEPYLITLKRGRRALHQFRHAGVEFLYMLSGKVRYRHADRTYLMEPGDALFFDAAARHGPEELIEAPMQYLSIIIYPRRN